MDKIYDIFSKSDALIFDSMDASLSEFLSIYYTIITPDKTGFFENILVYTDNFRESILLIPGVKYIWSKYSLPDDARQFLSGDFIVELMDIKNEYIKRFPSGSL